MLAPRVRLALAVAAFAVGTYRLVVGDNAGLLLLAASAFLAYGYFRYGTVWLAFREVAHGNLDKAARLLGQIKRPDALAPQERAYFELASGLIGAARAQHGSAEAHLRLGLQHGLRTDNDRALAEAVLAQVLIARDALDEAREVLERASARTCRPAIAARIREMQAGLSV